MENMSENHVVIMAGGIGSRLWPVSRPEFPKQFIDILGTGRTLIQMTADRFRDVCPPENMWVVTSAGYVDIVREQLPEIPLENILAEPQARNTAPCIAYACWKIGKRHPLANIVVTPSDAVVLEKEKFVEAVKSALKFTCSSDAIATIGIIPSRPETGYGYIHSPGAEAGKVCKVSEFREKPDLETARAFLSEGGFFWNAGIFVWNRNTIETALRKYAPGIASLMDRMSADFYTSREAETVGRLFPQCEKISIDYAVMEKSQEIYVVTGSFGWSDLGNWSAVRLYSTLDSQGNATVGDDVRLFGCSDCIVHCEDSGTIVAEGLEGYLVASKNGDILICPLSQEQRIKEFLSVGK